MQPQVCEMETAHEHETEAMNKMIQIRALNDFRGHVFDPGHKIFALWDRVRTRFSLSGVGKCIVLDGEGWC